MQDKAAEFLKTAHLYHLGDLDTEKPNPKTRELSSLAKHDLPHAIKALSQVDADALQIIQSKTAQILELREAIHKTWGAGNRVFLIGCGATGRLSLALESMYREVHVNASVDVQNRVVALMAGGDVALVHSLEGFEDFPAYAERHLQDLGFQDGDLLLAITEGGETPYVIGGVEYAARTSRAPYFLYCNPDAILLEKVERSKRVLTNKNIHKINLAVGPMALTGSTRMQASTVLQLAAGLALLSDLNAEQMRKYLRSLSEVLQSSAVDFLNGFIEREATEYLEERYIIYKAYDYIISIFTDTTERAPTFSLTPFSHAHATRLLKLKPSLSYVMVPQAKTAADAWKLLLKRSPRPLNWVDVDDRTSSSYLEAFDFGPGAISFREQLTKGVEHNFFEIEKKSGNLEWRLMDLERQLLFESDDDTWRSKSTVSALGADLLFEHTILKMLLNMHSTLVMGRLGRYEENLMTYVFPTNGKLIDRAARYVGILLERKGLRPSYEQIVREIFKQHENLKSGTSVVLNTVAALS